MREPQESPTCIFKLSTIKKERMMREWQWAKANIFKRSGWVVQDVLIDCNTEGGLLGESRWWHENCSWVVLLRRESIIQRWKWGAKEFTYLNSKPNCTTRREGKIANSWEGCRGSSVLRRARRWREDSVKPWGYGELCWQLILNSKGPVKSFEER